MLWKLVRGVHLGALQKIEVYPSRNQALMTSREENNYYSEEIQWIERKGKQCAVLYEVLALRFLSSYMNNSNHKLSIITCIF